MMIHSREKIRDTSLAVPPDPIFFSGSMAEYSAVNRRVVSSSPTWGAERASVQWTVDKKARLKGLVFCRSEWSESIAMAPLQGDRATIEIAESMKARSKDLVFLYAFHGSPDVIQCISNR